MSENIEIRMEMQMERDIEMAVSAGERPLLQRLKWPLIILAGAGMGVAAATCAHFGLSHAAMVLESFKYSLPSEAVAGLSVLSSIIPAGAASACAHDKIFYL